MMGVLNFAHTSFYMVGAYLAYSLEKVLGFWPAIIVSPLIVGVLGALVERYLLRRVHRYGHGHQLLLTFGVRSEEHTSQLQSLMRISYAVFCLKKKTTKEQSHG